MSKSYTPTLSPLYSRSGHRQWLNQERQRLLDFSRASRLAGGGFGPLDAKGEPVEGATASTMITARMTHCFAIAALEGIPGAWALARHGVDALLGPLRDTEFGGWYSDASEIGEGDKLAYIHAFVALAASSGEAANIPGSHLLMEQAIEVIERHFWSDAEGCLMESFSRDWSVSEDYRGANSNMHAVEAFLALGDVTGNPLWRQRALSIARQIIHLHAAHNQFAVVEHFTADWTPDRDYNVEHPVDPFRPYGVTPGHAFEWARLLLNLEHSLLRYGEDAPGWLLADARQLFETACTTGWEVDGQPGLVYTLDWNKQPKIHHRMHWTLAEASAAAAALGQRTGERRYNSWYRTFWDYIAMYLIDLRHGSWHHELDRDNRPSALLWGGKADLYHAYQATLLPQLPLSPTLASAMRLRANLHPGER